MTLSIFKFGIKQLGTHLPHHDLGANLFSLDPDCSLDFEEGYKANS